MADEQRNRLKRLTSMARAAVDDRRVAEVADLQQARLLRFIHFWALVVRSFTRNRCPVRASALAYGSLLALVPMLAVVISISATFLHRQGEDRIETFINNLVEQMTPNTEVPWNSPTSTSSAPVTEAPSASGTTNAPNAVATNTAASSDLFNPEQYERTRKDVATEINNFIGKIRSGALGASGVVTLLFIAIMMLGRIEDAFNEIWGVSRGRTWLARVAQYWTALTLGPLLLVTTMTLTTGPYLDTTKDLLMRLGPLGAWAIQLGMKLLPYLIWSLAFALFYMLIPNTKVQWRAALVGGIVGGCLWQLNSVFSVLYVSRVVTNSRIYGSLGMVPVFMIGLYFAWIILLFGAQVAYAWQNRISYLRERQVEGVNERSREFVALRLMAHLASNFIRGDRPLTLVQLSETAGVPTQLVTQLIGTLVATRLVTEVADKEVAYVPARPLAQISAQDVLTALRAGRGSELSTRPDEARTLLRAEFDRIGTAERDVASELSLEALANRLVQQASQVSPPDNPSPRDESDTLTQQDQKVGK